MSEQADQGSFPLPTEAELGEDGRRRWHGADGPHPVGGYAKAIASWMGKRPRVALVGEVVSFRDPGKSSVYFQLRDGDGAVPCAMWRNDFEGSSIGSQELSDGAQVVVAGRPSYYPGSRTASPGFAFRCDRIELAGEGELLRELARLRKLLESEGLTERQRALPRLSMPHAIGVVTGESGEARRDLVAGLERRGWGGRIVWAFAPVQDRHAAPAIARAIQDLAASGAVDAIVITRGGGSLLDLWAFCDETLCRTVAMLATPVIAAVGHHRDNTLIDSVAAVSCSTPTHAAEAVVALEPSRAAAELRTSAAKLDLLARRCVAARTRELAGAAQAPPRHVAALRATLHQKLREVRAASREGLADRSAALRRAAGGLPRHPARATRHLGEALRAAERTVAAHDPQRTLERGYARVESAGRIVSRVADLEAGDEISVSFSDGRAEASTTKVERRAIGEDAGDE